MGTPKSKDIVYKKLSAHMRAGLKNIYQQISTASVDEISAHKTNALFHEASDQLNEVVKATESAAMNIMEVVEKRMEMAEESFGLLANLKDKLRDDPDVARLVEINEKIVEDLTTVLTNLSFQDITGQRIKKVVSTLGAIESSVVDLYLSSGLIMDGAEKDPAKDAESLRHEAQKAVENFRENKKSGSQLKGPDKNGASQSAIDDMLAQLGL